MFVFPDCPLNDVMKFWRTADLQKSTKVQKVKSIICPRHGYYYIRFSGQYLPFLMLRLNKSGMQKFSFDAKMLFSKFKISAKS